MNLKYHYTAGRGFTQLVTPQTHPVEELDFGILRLEGSQQYQSHSTDCEVGLVILTGSCNVDAEGQTYRSLGGRKTVFDGRATGVYIPYQNTFSIEAGPAGVEIALCRCSTFVKHPLQVVRPENVVAREVGAAGYKRYVHDIFGLHMQAGTMIVGETFTLAGNWSSFPPHKHDVEALPDEVQQEELYFYKVRPVEGFGLQYIYSKADSPHGELDQAFSMRNNDLAIIPFGYHPVAAPPGYDVYYLWFLAGRRRLMRPNDDPTHAWIKTTQEGSRVYPT